MRLGDGVRVHELVEPRDLSVAHREDVGELALERLSGRPDAPS
jgi:hypothetical protein